MQRITNKDLVDACKRINQIMGANPKPYTRDSEGKYRANIGTYYIDGAYGGFSLFKMVSEGGGVNDVFGYGHITKRELYERMQAFIRGFEVKLMA